MPAFEPGKSRGLGFFLKIFFSLWIVFHLLVMVLMPNTMSYPGRTLAAVVRPYAAVLGLNAFWNFFSPDPAHTMYLKFTLYNEDSEGNSLTPEREMFLPSQKDGGILDLGKRRELYAMRFMLLDPSRVDAILGPWLCRHYGPVTEIRIEHVVNSVPTLDEAVLFGNREVKDMSHEFGFGSKKFYCSQVGEGAPQ
jgi:hypothetical protein